MSSAMDALKYSNYMSAGMGLYSSFAGQPQQQQQQQQQQESAATPTSSPSGGGHNNTTSQDLSQQMMMKNGGYTADALSRSYLEQQKNYYESVGLKGYGGMSGESNNIRSSSNGGGFDVKSFTAAADSSPMSGRHSADSPDLKKAEAAALQAYYTGAAAAAGGGAAAATGLPPLLPMAAAAQLSQYSSAAAAAAGSMYPMQGSPGPDFSRKPLSVLF
jgi:hypothetical protein